MSISFEYQVSFYLCLHRMSASVKSSNYIETRNEFHFPLESSSSSSSSSSSTSSSSNSSRRSGSSTVL